MAKFEVLAYRRDRGRDRHQFDDKLLDQLAEANSQVLSEPDDRTRAFEACLRALPKHQRELLEARYSPGGSVKDMAGRRGQSVGALSVTLSRIRKSLSECVRRKTARVGS